jgi:hypothetical protein
MTVVESMRGALQGMQRIEQEIIDRVCARGTRVDASNFCWNNGRSRAQLPLTFVHMEVSVGSRQTTAEWSRTVLEDSRERIDRKDVRQGIDHVVEKLAPRGILPTDKAPEIA